MPTSPALRHAPSRALPWLEAKRAAPTTRAALAALAPEGSFEGYASLFNVPDLGGDVIAPGAFRDSLRTRGPRGIRMLFQHDPSEPIGMWDELTEDARGLFVRGRLLLDVARAREVLALLRAGALDGLSIGFRAVAGRREARSGTRRLTRMDLWEISIVTFPLLPQARVEHAMRTPVAAGARFVLLDGALARLGLTHDDLGLAYFWRCGPASRSLGDSTYFTTSHAFRGEGLRPLSPVHVRGTRSPTGDLAITWTRRTRTGGDTWETPDVPLGEDAELYAIDMLSGSSIIRSLTSTTPSLTYPATTQTTDFGSPQPSLTLRISQVSPSFGPGTPTTATL